MELRPYQSEVVEAVYAHLRERDDNPCVVIPTAGGKTPVMATICKDAVGQWSGRVLVLAHVKELLEQAADKLRRICPEIDVGVYSAGLKRRDTEHAVIVAGVQSVYKRACELGRFDLVLVDEAHMIPPDGEGMYRTLLAEMHVINPHVRVVGLTATPFRMKSGMICAPDHFLNAVCYEVGVRELIRDGYLCKLVTKAGSEKADTSGLHVRAGEFIASETEALMDQDALVQAACREIVQYTRERHSCLVFATGVKHGRHLADALRSMTAASVATVFGDTLSFEREQTLDEFREGRLKYLVNVNVLTTGFDAPNIDSVAIVRPTLSPGLYYQMVGRGFRLHPGKEDCLVLDFGGNVMRHGPVDAIRPTEVNATPGEAPMKECPECHSVIAAGYATCPDCGYEFPPPERRSHDAKASTAGILSDQTEPVDYEVTDTFYGVHVKRGAPPEHPKTMRVEYQVGLSDFISEWVCPEHTGYARRKFEDWWARRSDAFPPDTAEAAVALAEEGALCETRAIRVEYAPGDKWPRVVGHVLGDKPPWREPGWDEDIDRDREQTEPVHAGWPDLRDDEIPF